MAHARSFISRRGSVAAAGLLAALSGSDPAGQGTPPAASPPAYVFTYFDAYTTKHYGALRSRDLVTWEDVTGQLTFPVEGTEVRMRHGTVIEVPAALTDALRGQTR